MGDRAAIVVSGLVIGIITILLVVLGNPANMGYCIACFVRDIAGGLGFHRAAVVQYLRPEIMGLILGAFIIALKYREFRATGGSSVMLRFMLGMFMMMGALIFLGCPWRMLLRLAGGDLNALVAFPGYLAGIWAGTLFLKQGYTLGQAREQSNVSGLIGPLLAVALLLLLVAAPALLFFSEEGPGSMRAPLYIALAAGLIVGVLSQRTRFCTMGAFRDIILFRDYHLFSGVAALFLAVLAGNLLLGSFDLGFMGQPVAHTDGIWNFLGMGIVGLAAVLAGGCPLRQLILTGEGNGDAMVTVLGLTAGAAVMHNFGWAGSPAGVSSGGQVMVIVVLLLLTATGWLVVRQIRVDEAREQKGTSGKGESVAETR